MYKKRINIFLYHLIKTGGIRILLEYASRLSNRGYDVTVYHSIVPYKHYEKEGVKLYFKKIKEKGYYLNNYYKFIKQFTGFPINFKIELVPFLSNIFVRESDSVIFSYWPIANHIPKILQQKTIIYLIQAYESWDCSDKLLHNTYKCGFINIVTSKYLQEKLYKNFNVDSKVIHNGIDTSYFKAKVRYFQGNKLKIGFFNYSLGFKGSGDIILALDVINKKYGNSISIIGIGNGSKENHRNYIHYYDGSDDDFVRRLYGICDIFISGSYEEGFYLVPLEAISAKCISVTTNVGVIKESFVDKEHLLTYEPGDIYKLVNNIEFIINNISEAESIINNGYNKVLNDFNWNDSLNELERLL